jgi:adenosine deaminase
MSSQIHQTAPNILIATLGTWALVPEVVGFTNPALVDLYRHHPQAEQIRKRRKEWRIMPVDEVWVITSAGTFSASQGQKLNAWHLALCDKAAPRLRIWRVLGTENLSAESECRTMTEAIFRLVLMAQKISTGGQLLLSLAGGRKTMSADLQRAASVFGCHALIHVTQNDNDEALTRKVRQLTPEQLTTALPLDFHDAVTPLIVGRYPANPAVLQAVDDGPPIDGAAYPLPWAEAQADIVIEPNGPLLAEEIEQRLERSAFLLCNYSNRMASENSANFMALYGLAPEAIHRLQETKIGVDPAVGPRELAWLRQLPKAELHCHLGGVLDAADMIRVAQANSDLLENHRERLAPAIRQWRGLIDHGDASIVREKVDFKGLRHAVPGIPEPVCVSAFLMLFEQDPAFLDEVIFGLYRNESAYGAIGFKNYEAMGDLQGSGLLQSEASIVETCRILAEKALSDNVRCLELRCSPHNYTRAGLDAAHVVALISRTLRQSGLPFGLILTAGRHQDPSEIQKILQLARALTTAQAEAFRNVRAVDLAGDEQACPADRLRSSFLPLMKECIHITIHAGETASAESIWQAVYHLSAERIGHGLTLQENPSLMEKFRDRDIAIEMCPSSNLQIIGFSDNYMPTGDHATVYPLKKYMNAGLRVTVNTDNPGISRTDLSRELLRAARMTSGGLSQWEILQLIRNGFKASFLDRTDKQRLLRGAEKRILALLESGRSQP